MKIQRFELSFFGVNTYIVWDPATSEAAIIDPGMSQQQEVDEIDSFIEENSLKVKHLINTHLHIDHVFGNKYITERYGVQPEAHPDDAPLGRNVGGQAMMFGMRINPGNVEIAHPLHQGDKVMLGNESLEVIHVPGHSPGGICLYDAKDGFVITGDAIFRESIGRTDLPGGNHAQLIGAIRRGILSLPPQTVIYPGHGPSSTVEHELRANPFL